MKWLALIMSIILTGCACTAKEVAPSAAGHAISGIDAWAIADVAVGALVEMGRCYK